MGGKGKDRASELSPDEVGHILDSISDGVFTVSLDFDITSFNRAAERITGVPREEAVGRPCREVFRSTRCESSCVLRKTMETKRPIVNQPVSIIRADGTVIPISVSTALFHGPGGNIIGGVETFRDLSLVEQLRKELRGTWSFEDIIGKNHRMQALFRLLPKIADSDSTVLIEGASGTGKELVARAVHNLGPRADRPFVPVNLGALPDTLLESELFGHVAGAFTDARSDRKGRFAAAEGGTIFLDEIGDISPTIQVKLLRVLQDHRFTPLGSDREVRADVRVITATNRNLEKEIGEGRFREDLFFRVNVVRLTLPPLQERKEDIPLLVEHFVDKFNRLKKKDLVGLSDRAMRALLQYDWSGNVRELENAIEFGFVLCSGGIIDTDDLPEKIRPSREPLTLGGLSLKEIEKKAVREALERNNWKRLATARELEIDKNTLRRKINAYGLERDQSAL
jgi:PAS domain S-box-containing protein